MPVRQTRIAGGGERALPAAERRDVAARGAKHHAPSSPPRCRAAGRVGAAGDGGGRAGRPGRGRRVRRGPRRGDRLVHAQGRRRVRGPAGREAVRQRGHRHVPRVRRRQAVLDRGQRAAAAGALDRAEPGAARPRRPAQRLVRARLRRVRHRLLRDDAPAGAGPRAADDGADAGRRVRRLPAPLPAARHARRLLRRHHSLRRGRQALQAVRGAEGGAAHGRLGLGAAVGDAARPPAGVRAPARPQGAGGGGDGGGAGARMRRLHHVRSTRLGPHRAARAAHAARARARRIRPARHAPQRLPLRAVPRAEALLLLWRRRHHHTHHVRAAQHRDPDPVPGRQQAAALHRGAAQDAQPAQPRVGVLAVARRQVLRGGHALPHGQGGPAGRDPRLQPTVQEVAGGGGGAARAPRRVVPGVRRGAARAGDDAPAGAGGGGRGRAGAARRALAAAQRARLPARRRAPRRAGPAGEAKEAGAATAKFQALRRFFSRGRGGGSSSTAEAPAPAPAAYAPAASTAGDVGSQEEQSGATPTPPLKPGRKTTPRAASKLTAHLKPLPGTRGPPEAGPQPGSLPVPQPGEQPGSTSGGQPESQPGHPTERQSAGAELMKGVFGAAAWGRSPDMLACVLLGLAAAVAVWLLGSILFVCLKLRGGRRDAGRAAASDLAGPRGGPGGPDAYPELLGDTDRPADGRHAAKMRHEARAPPRRRRWWPCGHRRSPTDHDCPVCLEGAELPCPHRPAEPSSSVEEAEHTSSAADSRSDLDSHPSREGGICGWMSSLFASCAAEPGVAGARAGGAGGGGGGGAPKRTCRCECGGDGRNCCWRTTCCGGDREAGEPCTPEHKCGLGDCYGQCGAAGPGGRGQRPPPSSTSATSEELATVRLGSAGEQDARGKVPPRFVVRPGAAGPPHPPAAGKQAAGVESRPSSGATEALASPSEAESAPQSSTDARWRSSRAAEGGSPLATPRRTLDPRDAARPSQSRGTEGAADARRARHSEPPAEARRSQGAEPRRSHRNPEPTSEARRFQEGEPWRSHRQTRDSEPTTEVRRTRYLEPHESHRHARESDPTAGPRRTRTSDPLESSTEALDAELPGSMRRRPGSPMRSLVAVQEPPGSGRTQGLNRDLTERPEDAQLPGSAEQSRRSGPPENSRRTEFLAVIPESPAARNSRMQAPEDELSGTRRPQRDSEFKDPNAEPLESDKQPRHSQRASVTKTEDTDSAETTRPSRGSIKFARPLESESQKSTDYEPSVNQTQSRKSRAADPTTDPERRRKSRDSASGEPSRRSRDDSAPSINPTRRTREPDTLDRPKQPSTSEGSPGPQRRESTAGRRAGSESPKPRGGPGAAEDRRSGRAPRESADRKRASAPEPRWDQNVMTAQTTAQILYAPTSMAPTWKSASQSPSPSPPPPPSPPSRASSSAAKRRAGTSADRPISPRWR